MNAIIIDDEKKGRALLNVLIKENCPEVNILGMGSNVKEGIDLIKALSPDVVFLDVEMPGGSGFDLLAKVDHTKFSVIFTTAYEEYAVRAFKFSAIDYLLKPIDENELVRAIKKVNRNKHSSLNEQSFEIFRNNYYNSNNSRIALTTARGLVFTEIKELERCEAFGKYTTCFFSNNRQVIVTKNLKEFETILTDHNFIRLHNSHLVNLNYIKEYHQARGGHITMINGKTIPVSQRKKEEFIRRLTKV